MSICDDVQRVVAQQEETLFDVKVCKMYEEAEKSFQDLVDRGVAFKRGYQLLPIESAISNSIDFNVGYN